MTDIRYTQDEPSYGGFSEEIVEISRRTGATFADIADLASGQRGRQQVYGNGDIDGGMWWASQAQGLINDVSSCADVVRTIIDDARRIVTGTLPEQIRG